MLPEEFHHAILRLSDEDIKELHLYVDAVSQPEFLDILMSEIRRRKIEIDYGNTIPVRERLFNKHSLLI